MLRFSANISFLFQEAKFLDRFSEAAGAGFKGVEFSFAYEHPAAEIAEAAKGAGVSIVLMNLPPGDWLGGDCGMAAIPGRESEFAASLELALDYAKICECRQVHAMAGAGSNCSEETYVSNLRYAAERANEFGIRLLIEPINTTDLPGYFLNLPEQAERIIRKVGSPNLFLQMDLYHYQIMRGDLARHVERQLQLVRHIQIAGNPGRHEPDIGEINYAFLLSLLDRLGYSGWIGCEYRPVAGTRAGLSWMQAMIRSD